MRQCGVYKRNKSMYTVPWPRGKENHPCGKEVPLAEFVPYLIVCPLVFIAGFVDAVAGGGGLISLPAYLISGLSLIHISEPTRPY